MPSLKQILSFAPALLAAGYCQGTIQSAQGTKGSPASLSLGLSTTGTDANIINTAEITSNVVNECGRTLLSGNIDVGENTENQLANKTVTSVTKGSTVAVTIKQGSASGAGPYTCDLDLTGNADGATGQSNLTVAETDSKNGNIALKVTMPSDLACIGASTGNVCTMRCFNTAAAGPFGGCVALQQTDTTASVNQADTITTAQTLDGILAQVASNQKDLPAAIKANQDATSGTEAEQGVLAVADILGTSTGASVAATTSSSSAASATSTKAAGTKKGNGNGNGKNAGRAARAFFS